MASRLFSVLFGLVLLGGCSSGSNPSTGTPDPGSIGAKFTTQQDHKLNTFAGCDAFRDAVTEALTLEFTTDFWSGLTPCWSCVDGVFLAEGAPVRAVPVGPARGDANDELSADSPAPAAPTTADERRVNDTNTQEQGVDEADLVEVNAAGTTLYALYRPSFGQAAEVLVISAQSPEAPEILTRLRLDDERFVSGLYLDDPNNRLLIVTEGGFFFPQPLASNDLAIAPAPMTALGSQVLSYDVSDPAQPRLLGQFNTDAQIIGSRRIDDQLHLVSQWGIPQPPALRNDESFFQLVYEDYAAALRRNDEQAITALRAQIASRIADAVRSAAISDLLPRNNGLTLACEAIHAPSLEQRLGLIQVSSMATDTSAPRTIGLLNNGWQIYASADNLYISQTSGGWWFDPEQGQQTAIHRFALQPNAAPAYRGSGVVDGWTATSFQYSEFAGHLRVATTLRGPGLIAPTAEAPRLLNLLTVLALDADGLNPVGRSPRFAPNEDIRAARFFGERGFVVTFEFTDPLFAFDLSDPSNPRITAELEIPGFSSYIFPLGSDRLLTIGRTGGPDGLGVGNSFQLQIFDVAGAFDDDPQTGLQRLATSEIALQSGEYAFSLAEYDPLAFNFLGTDESGVDGVLSIPVQIGSPDASRAFSGFYTYAIAGSQSPPQINEQLQINHALQDNAGSERCPSGREPPSDAGLNCSSFAPIVYNEPLRTKILAVSTLPGVTTPATTTRYFYTFSSRQLKVDTPDTGLTGGSTAVTTLRFDSAE